MSEWTIEDQDEMTHQVSDLISIIKNTPKGKNPEILKLLDQFQEEKDAAKNIAILTKIIEKLYLEERNMKPEHINPTKYESGHMQIIGKCGTFGHEAIRKEIFNDEIKKHGGETIKLGNHDKKEPKNDG